MTDRSVIVVGAGVFGATAALELRRRGWDVMLLDPGPIPHPLAASTDISKVIRMEYGPDVAYMRLAEEAREGWLTWNERWREEEGRPLYHETGVLMLSREPMVPGTFEFESYRLLQQRQHSPERMTPDRVATRFPAWNAERHIDGFYHEKGGFAESGDVVRALTTWARQEGVDVRGAIGADHVIERNGRVVGVVGRDGAPIHADEVVIAAGVWTAGIVGLPQECLQPTGHPVFHLKPRDPAPFEASRFPTFTADVSKTGFYGFPLHRSGVVKVANHGPGRRVGADDPRAVSMHDETRLRDFLRATFPALADATITYTRLCLYTDTQDEDFWIARDPERDGLTVASGGSGHGFKFAPVLGGLIAETVEGVSHSLEKKFRWRPEVRMRHGLEAARAHGSERS